MKNNYIFGDLVVVEGRYIGVIVKPWVNTRINVTLGTMENVVRHEVYVRNYNAIREYKEEDIQRYVISKELSDEEKEWHL